MSNLGGVDFNPDCLLLKSKSCKSTEKPLKRVQWLKFGNKPSCCFFRWKCAQFGNLANWLSGCFKTNVVRTEGGRTKHWQQSLNSLILASLSVRRSCPVGLTNYHMWPCMLSKYTQPLVGVRTLRLSWILSANKCNFAHWEQWRRFSMKKKLVICQWCFSCGCAVPTTVFLFFRMYQNCFFSWS